MAPTDKPKAGSAAPAAALRSASQRHSSAPESAGQRPAAQRPAAQRPQSVQLDGQRPSQVPDTPLLLQNIRRPTGDKSGSSGGPSKPRLASNTYDKTRSVLGLPATAGAGGDAVAAFNQSHIKLVSSMNRCLAEMELRLDQRTLPIAQACVRLERLRHDIDNQGFSSDAELANVILEEYHSVVNRLEDICRSLQSCSNKPACCACQFTAPGQGGEEFTFLDHCTGREIQDFVVLHATMHATETGTLRAVYGNLSSFFTGILGHFEADKDRCKSRRGFLNAWRTMTQQPSYLNDLDRELGKVRDIAATKRARGEHNTKKAARVSLSGLFKGKDKDDRRASGASR
jgi:hypothetical protein